MPLTRGVRPNSPAQTTIVSSSSPRDSRSRIRAEIALSSGRQEAVAEGAEVVAVGVPAAEAQRHEPGAGLDQPPGRQRPLAQRRPAVVVAQRVRLARQVERGPDAVGPEDLRGLAMEAVEARHHLRGVERPQAAVEPVPQRLAGLEVAEREPLGERHPVGLERPPDRVALDLERAERRAEVAGPDARDALSQRGERDVRRDALPRRQQPRRQRTPPRGTPAPGPAGCPWPCRSCPGRGR